MIYVILDADYLIELANLPRTEFVAGSRIAWAEGEFIHTLRVFSTPPAPKRGLWRRLPGTQSLRHLRQLAVARVLWQERDLMARQRGRPLSRILTDAVIIEFASGIDPESSLPGAPEFSRAPGFNTRGSGRCRANWVRAAESVGRLSPSGYPSHRPEPSDIPQPCS